MGEDGLVLGSELAGSERYQGIILMPGHDAPNGTSLGFYDVLTIDGHWIAVVVILESSRSWAHPFKPRIEIEMSGWNAAQE